MFDTGSAWLMTSLNADPMAVSLVQVAASLPIVLFTLPASALARHHRLATDSHRSRDCHPSRDRGVRDARFVGPRQSSGIVADDLFAVRRLFADGAGVADDHASLGNHAGTRKRHSCQWGRLQHRPRRGPALAGLVVTGFGIASPFLARWRRQSRDHRCATLVALALEDGRKVARRALTSAVHTGLRYAANSRNLRAILIRAAAFFPFACASWALLPLVARSQMTQGPECYGTLPSMIGAGAVGGSFALDSLKARLGPDRLVAFASLIAAFGLVLLGIARDPIVALCASFVTGASWTLVVASLYAATQVALPDWVRAWTRNILGGFLRSDHGRKRGVGACRWHGRATASAFSGGGRRHSSHSFDMALETRDGFRE
jgi:transmembrane secretion effector